ncbi:hypothetical protein INT43_003216 [Umbelopsis isabellina]|uniref:Uncharacterized protein n=1 Tax=Mortierella isabellina TaxID=91625 RepID=A0A8H7UG41_MORIS|nr:hypothetical protein INT43_003216 [Umbelopsis isabellina]
MSVSRTRSKSSKGTSGKKKSEEQAMVEAQASNAVVAVGQKAEKQTRQTNEDIWDVGNVYNQDNMKPKKPIVTYSKRKYKPRPELGSLLTNIYTKGQPQKQSSKSHAADDSTSSQKPIAELQTKIDPLSEQHHDSCLTDKNGLSAINRQKEVQEPPQHEINGLIAKEHEADKNGLPLDHTAVIKSRSATGKQKDVNGNKSKPVKKSLSLSRTRKQKQEKMQQEQTGTASTLAAVQPPSPVNTQTDNVAQSIEIEDITAKEPKHSEPKLLRLDYRPAQYDQTSENDDLEISLDHLNISPIGNVSTEARKHKRIASSTPLSSRIQQHMHASKPSLSFAESLKKADVEIESRAEVLGSGISRKQPAELETIQDSKSSPPPNQFNLTELHQERAISSDDQRLAPASISDTEFSPIPINNAVIHLQNHRKAIEASIAEPTVYDLGNSQIWSPPRSPSIEAARRESLRSEGQNNIPEGIFEWFGSNVAHQDNSTSEQQPLLDEDLEQFLTPDQLGMTVEQFMRSIYEEKIEQVRKEGQQRIDRLDGAIARVRAKLLAELVECDS